MKYSSSIRYRFRMLMITIVVLTIVLTILLMSTQIKKLAQNVSREYAHLYTSELSGKLEARLQREIALTLKASRSNVVIAWMKDEDNEKLKKAAFEELQQFTQIYKDHNFSIAINESKNVYHIAENQDYRSFKRDGVLSELIPADIWYFETLNNSDPFMLNLGVDRFLNSMRAWINIKVEDNEKPLGVVGTGLYLDSIIKEIYSHEHNTGVKSVIINRDGDIQIDTDFSKIRQNSFSKRDDKSQTIFQYNDDPDFVSQIRQYMKHPDDYAVYDLKSGIYQYAALSPIHDTDWYVVTLFSTSALYNPGNYAPFLIMMLGATLLLAILINIVVSRTFVQPFELLKKSIQLKEATQDQKIYGLDRDDEFGELAHTIQQMTDRLIRGVPVGMFLVSKDNHFLYGNPYFLAQFQYASVNEFAAVMTDDPASLFVNHSDYEEFTSMIKDQPDIYSYEVEMLRKDGSHFWVEIRLTRVPHAQSGWQYEGILINIQRKKDYENTLVNLANIDSLTGLFNRHYFDHAVEEEVCRSERYGSHLSMLIFDLDHFKRVNDDYGHDIGDKVLAAVADEARSCLRKQDILVRWGGEEFAVLLPETSLSRACQVGEKIRMQLGKYDHSPAGKVTASFGVSEKVSEESFPEWFKRTDQALFRAKETGRNRVISAELPDQVSTAFVRLLWRDEFNSGNLKIDEQHQKLFSLGNKLIEDMLNKDYDKQIEDFAALEEHLKCHFTEEEIILASTDFPKYMLEKHIDEHANLLRRLSVFSAQLKDGSLQALDIIVLLINEVIIEHLNKEDVMFFPYMSPSE